MLKRLNEGNNPHKRQWTVTHHFPSEALHDNVFTLLQVLHHVVFQGGLSFNEALYHLVEVESRQLEDVQDPGEAQISFHRIAGP